MGRKRGDGPVPLQHVPQVDNKAALPGRDVHPLPKMVDLEARLVVREEQCQHTVVGVGTW